MGPLWAIIKCAAKGTDLSKTRVLQTLHLEPGFTVTDGWELKMWVRELTVPGKGKGKEVTATFKRPYLINNETLEVITIQLKAWMDTAGIVMWNEVQIAAWAARRTGRACIVWDNCGPHKTKAVQESFARTKVTQEELTPKMTDILQVMDLITNGPVKSGSVHPPAGRAPLGVAQEGPPDQRVRSCRPHSVSGGLAWDGRRRPRSPCHMRRRARGRAPGAPLPCAVI
mmetsp:Transcript_13433/g.45300  ORF Transcript_13433/g.45300 Transcript_13433/m.45300 type:complete len:227 (+) Transcript_13433:494-1174(+)